MKNVLTIFSLVLLLTSAVQAETNPSRTTAPASQTPLMFAVLNGDINKIKELLKSKVNVNENNAKGETALILAAEQGREDIVNLLLEGGADIKSQGVKALGKSLRGENASYAPYKKVVFLLLKKGIDLKNSSILLDVVGKWTEGKDAATDITMIVKALLKSGANADARRSNGYPALMYAVTFGKDSENLEIVKALIDHGADVNAQVSSSGPTALILAVARNDIQVAKILLDKGAKINVRDKDLRFDTPMARAAFLGNLDMLMLLVKRGGDVNYKSADGATPLIRAVQGRKLHSAEFLIQQSASINERDAGGFTPLYYAVKSVTDDFSRLLANPGTNTGVKSDKDNIVRSLVKLGADTSIKDKDGFPIPLISKDSDGSSKVVNKPSLNISWDGPLFVGYGQKWLLPIRCEELSKLEGEQYTTLIWSNSLLMHTYGLIKGDSVSVITTDGKILQQEMGDLSCIQGECRGDYVAVNLKSMKGIDKENNVITALSPSFISSQAKIEFPYKLSLEMLPNCQVSAPILSAQNVVKTTCENWGLDAKKQLILQIISQESPPNELGWSPINIHTRVFKKKGENWSTQNWLFLGKTMNRPIIPVGILNDTNQPVRILWRKEEGIGGPAEITVFFTSIEQDGSLKKGREYTAGGQPCD